MNRSVSCRLVSALTLALTLVACAEDDRATEADKDEDLQQNELPTSESTEDDDDVSEPALAPAPPCNTFATIYRDQATAQEVAADGQGRLMCLLSVDDAGVGNGWTVSYGDSCKCPAPRVLTLP